MIFITVGTHEQQFNRLIEKVDVLVKKQVINSQIYAQIGYTNYTPEYIDFDKMISYEKMDEYTSKSEIVITHGGPGSIMQVLAQNKVPIVVPRQRKHGEHVDDHQVYFTEKLEKEKMILAVYNIEELSEYINNHYELTKDIVYKERKGNKDKFINKLNEFSEFITR